MAARGFLERSLDQLLETDARALTDERSAAGAGWLQRTDGRIKLVALVGLLLGIALSRSLPAIGAVVAAIPLVALSSRLGLRTLFTRAWLPALIFTAVIAAPAPFLTPGRSAGTLFGLAITEEGSRAAAFLLARVVAAAGLSWLLTVSTPWARILSALSALRVPPLVVLLLSTTYRYLFLLLGTARDMLRSRRSRTVGTLPGPMRRQVTGAIAGSLLLRSLDLSREVHLAMRARGFEGRMRSLDGFRLRASDWAQLGAVVAVAILVGWSGR